MIKPYFAQQPNYNYTTLDGGSLGSWVEEDRGEMRELMVIAKFSRDSIDMSNAHCGDCLAGATKRRERERARERNLAIHRGGGGGSPHSPVELCLGSLPLWDGTRASRYATPQHQVLGC